MREQKSQGQSAPTKPISDAKAYEDAAIAALRNSGYRITMPRVQVIRALADTKTALSAYAVHEKIITSEGKIDVVSVYRILSTLQEVGLAYHIGIVDGYFPCLLPTSARHSAVLVDEQTGEIHELSLPEIVIETIQNQVKDHGFSPNTIKIEITGSKL